VSGPVANVDEPPAQGRCENGPITVVGPSRPPTRTGYRGSVIPHSTTAQHRRRVCDPRRAEARHRRHSRKTHIGIGIKRPRASRRRNYRGVIPGPRSHQERRRHRPRVGGPRRSQAGSEALTVLTFPAPVTAPNGSTTPQPLDPATPQPVNPMTIDLTPQVVRFSMSGVVDRTRIEERGGGSLWSGACVSIC